MTIRDAFRLRRGFVPCLLAALVFSTGALAQGPSTAHIFLMRIWQQGVNTPQNMGYLPLAEAEAKAALLHANKALDAFGDPVAVNRELMEVVHALDPAREEQGESLGFGLTHAAASIMAFMQTAMMRPDASGNVKEKGKDVAASADHVIETAREAQILADEFRKTPGQKKAELVTIRDDIATALSGRDENGDGTISAKEGGLQQIRAVMAKMLQGEGF